MTARRTPKALAGHLSYYRRWIAQHRVEAEIMTAKGWRWSVGLALWIPARKETTR